eukprot:jgi/Bigna1/88434/estExt_fgenesh1_pg.C_320020
MCDKLIFLRSSPRPSRTALQSRNWCSMGENKSKTTTRKDLSRILYTFLCLPLILLAVYLDTDAVRLECERPVPAGKTHECQFVSYLDDKGQWSYFSIFSSPSIKEDFNLVDLLTSHVRTPNDGRKKQGKGRFGSKRAEEEENAEATSNYGVELGLASGVRMFWNDYPTQETATHMSREIDDFIRDSSSTKKPIRGKFVHDPTVFEEVLVFAALCGLVYFLSLTPFCFGEAHPWLQGFSSETIKYDVYHDYCALTILWANKKIGKKQIVPLIDAETPEEAKDSATEMNRFAKECLEYSDAKIREKKKNKKEKVQKAKQQKRKNAAAAAAAAAAADDKAETAAGGEGESSNEKEEEGGEKAPPPTASTTEPSSQIEADDYSVMPPPTSFLQNAWDTIVSYLVPLVVAAAAYANAMGYTLSSLIA